MFTIRYTDDDRWRSEKVASILGVLDRQQDLGRLGRASSILAETHVIKYAVSRVSL